MNQELEFWVHEAEKQRAAGDLERAIALARQYADIKPEEIETHENLPPLMQLWRIWAVSLMSLSQKQWNGNKAANCLLQAREVFERFYHHPQVIEAAPEMDQDSRQAEYRMRAEMLRDEGKLWQYWAGLTGNTFFLDKAIECFNQAIQATLEGTSVWGVATMEKEIATRLKGGKINWAEFSRAYETVVELSPQTGGWDRKAAVSWWYVKEALLARRKAELIRGLNNLHDACQEGKVNWITRYPLRELWTFILGVSRRITYSGGDSQ